MTQDWLAAREPLDARCRSAELAIRFVEALAPETVVVDLGCGTGANLRYLLRHLPAGQRWLAIDQDPRLLAIAASSLPNARGRCEPLDLATSLVSVPSGPGFAVSASAFLDLTSPEWLAEFAVQLRETPVLIAMTTAGLPEFAPAEEEDAAIGRVLGQHQQSNHGFGAAAGMEASSCLAARLRDQGCRVTLAATDWQLATDQAADDAAMVERMVRGIARRVRAMSAAIPIDAWEARRLAQRLRGQLRLTVPHLDLLSLPA